MGIGAAGAMWLARRLKQLRPAAPADAARRLLSDVSAAMAAGREAKRDTEADLWSRLGPDTANGAPAVIQLPASEPTEEPFAPLRKALGQQQHRR